MHGRQLPEFSPTQASKEARMKCRHIDEHLRSLGTWVNWDKTTDIFTFGSPDTAINKIAVAWKPTMAALMNAKAEGANFFISHESIGVRAVNGSMQQDVEFMMDSEREIFDFLTESSFVVYRCHDLLDAMPEWGVMCAWQEGLDLGGEIILEKYPHITTEIAPLSTRDLASHIIAKTASLGQNFAFVSGNPEKQVSRIATGTGMIHDIDTMRMHNADVSIVVDDAYSSVRMGSHMRDLDYPIIIVNHGVAEEWALENLSGYLRDSFPSIEIIYIPQYCPYEVVCM